MKCNNCGVNFDDEDRECPMCGTPAGAGKKRFMPHYTEYGHTDHTDGSCTHQTYTQKYTSKPNTSKPAAHTQQPGARQNKASPKSTMLIIVVIVIGMLFSVLPEILRDVRYALEEMGWSMQSGAAEPTQEQAAVDLYDYEANRVMSAEVLGEYSAADTGAGNFTLLLDDEDHYIFSFEGDGWRYDESGWVWCVYNLPEEELYDPAYTPDQYDSYTLCLTFDEVGNTAGARTEAVASHLEQGEMWLLAYVSQTDGSVVLDDADGDAAAFFGGNRFLTLQGIQKG